MKQSRLPQSAGGGLLLSERLICKLVSGIRIRTERHPADICAPQGASLCSGVQKTTGLNLSFYVNYNAIFDTGCIGLQSCIEMQPKMGMQLLEIIT